VTSLTSSGLGGAAGGGLLSGNSADEFTSGFLGAGYRGPTWSATARLEYRDGVTEDRSVLSVGVYRETVAGQAFSLALRAADSSGTRGDGTSVDTRLSWAYRPDASRWVVLDRLDLLFDERGTTRSARAVNNLHANLQYDPRTQVGLQLGLRYAEQQFDADRYGSVSTLAGLDVRHDLDARWDLGVQGTLFATPGAATREHSFGVDVGRRFGQQVWVSLGWNFAGFADQDFSRERYTAQGPFVRFRVNIDQGGLKDLVQGWKPGSRR
jgi:hypothetical protein